MAYNGNVGERGGGSGSDMSVKRARARRPPRAPYRFDSGVAVVPKELASRSRPLAELGDGHVAVLVPGDLPAVRFFAPPPPAMVSDDVASMSPFEPAAEVVTLEGRMYDAPLPRRVRRRLARLKGRRRSVSIGPRSRIAAYHADDLCTRPHLVFNAVDLAMEAYSAR